jgi:hypothetical protein
MKNDIAPELTTVPCTAHAKPQHPPEHLGYLGWCGLRDVRLPERSKVNYQFGHNKLTVAGKPFNFAKHLFLISREESSTVLGFDFFST